MHSWCQADVKAKEYAQGKALYQEPSLEVRNVLDLCKKTTRALFWPFIYLSILWKEFMSVDAQELKNFFACGIL